MDQFQYTTTSSRIKGKHLTPIERGMIQALSRQGYSLRRIAREVGCSPSTIHYELRRGTKERTSSRGRPPLYSATLGQQTYEDHRRSCHRPCIRPFCDAFLDYVHQKLKEDGWSLDECARRAKHLDLFEGQRVSAKTLYLWTHKHLTPFSLMDLPQVLSRRKTRTKTFPHPHQRLAGRSIEEREDFFGEAKDFGHWEIDTVLGQKRCKTSAILTLVERSTNYYLALKIPGKTTEAVTTGIRYLHQHYGSKFSEVFQSITSDNGSEFHALPIWEEEGTYIFYAHPRAPWERGKNEKHNALLRTYIPKGSNLDHYSEEDITFIQDNINTKPRKQFVYRTPEELFEAELDSIYQRRDISV